MLKEAVNKEEQSLAPATSLAKALAKYGMCKLLELEREQRKRREEEKMKEEQHKKRANMDSHDQFVRHKDDPDNQRPRYADDLNSRLLTASKRCAS